jgi:hypothetical protein
MLQNVLSNNLLSKPSISKILHDHLSLHMLQALHLLHKFHIKKKNVYIPLAGSCEQCNQTLDFIKDKKFLE